MDIRTASETKGAPVDPPAVSTKEQFVELIESRKASRLPKTLNYQERERAALTVKRAQGWLRSSFFRFDSSETNQHIAALIRIGGAL